MGFKRLKPEEAVAKLRYFAVPMNSSYWDEPLFLGAPQGRRTKPACLG